MWRMCALSVFILECGIVSADVSAVRCPRIQRGILNDQSVHDQSVQNFACADSFSPPRNTAHVGKLKDAISLRQRYLDGVNVNYVDENSVAFILFAIDTLEDEKRHLQLRPDGVNTLTISRRSVFTSRTP
jgi:hypothetical protein